MDMNILRPSALAELFGKEDASVFHHFLDPETAQDTEQTIVAIFGPSENKKKILIAGGLGIVGFGKSLQFASRLYVHGVKTVVVDLPETQFDWNEARKLLAKKFTLEKVEKILRSIIVLQTNHTGQMTEEIQNQDVAIIFEAIPEKKDLKQSFFKHVRSLWPEAILLSATSGFQAKVLFNKIKNPDLCTIAHPSFPHLTNKWFEVVGPGSQAPIDEVTYKKVVNLFLAIGLVPKRVKDAPSFVLDRIFCGLLNCCLSYMEETNFLPQQIDTMAKKLFGPQVNPFFSHDFIAGKHWGAANALSLSCLTDLDRHYGGNLFAPHPELRKADELAKDKHQFVWCRNSAPGNIAPQEGDEELFREYTLGGLAVIVSQILHEEIAGIETINGITEKCALFAKGILSMFKSIDKEEVCRLAQKFITIQDINPKLFHPEVFEGMHNWFLYVNVEIVEDQERFGLVTFSRDSYSWMLDEELNRAFDFLQSIGVDRVLVAPDFATSSQFGVGAETTEFVAIKEPKDGVNLSYCWSRTVRRLTSDFKCSAALVRGRAWGGMLELALHCHHVFAEKESSLRFPEVTMKIIPGMDGLHLPFRRIVDKKNQQWVYKLLMNGEAVSGKEAAGHGLITFAGSWKDVIKTSLGIMNSKVCGTYFENTVTTADLTLEGLPVCRVHERGFVEAYSSACRTLMLLGIKQCCSLPYSKAIEQQSRISGRALFAPWGFLKKK